MTAAHERISIRANCAVQGMVDTIVLLIWIALYSKNRWNSYNQRISCDIEQLIPTSFITNNSFQYNNRLPLQVAERDVRDGMISH